jgi:inhibitor of KinA sporulation pathway (predicted exonuclease)
MNYIVLDLEWNQSTTGKTRELKSLPFEIIEIGAVKLDEQFQITDRFEQLIRPVIYPQMNYISQEVTGFTNDELKNGGRFPAVMKRFLEWCGKEEFRFCTWGPTDITELQRNMRHYGMSLFPAPVFFYDIQEIFSIANEDGQNRRSLEYAVEFYHLKKSGDFHRALSDANYTALLMAHMDSSDIVKNYTIDTYQTPKNASEEVFINYGTHTKYVSQVFSNKIAALKNREVISTKCCKCGHRLRRKIQWFSENGKNYYALAFCPEHGYLTCKLRFKHTESDGCFALKELSLTDSEGAGAMYTRRAEYTRKRREKQKRSLK